MELNEFIYIINQFPFARKLTLQGNGEPFLNPYLLKMVKYAKINLKIPTPRKNFTHPTNETPQKNKDNDQTLLDQINYWVIVIFVVLIIIIFLSLIIKRKKLFKNFNI